jgi:hypothetical protein
MKEKQILISAATKYDQKQMRGNRWNPNALRIYLERLEDIEKDVASGATLRDALCAGFTGSLLNAMLRAVNLQKPSDDEWSGKGGMFYVPASDK